MTETRQNALRRADREIQRVAETYDDALASCLRDLQKAFEDGNLPEAVRIAQNIAGEADSFGWPAVGKLAAVFRDILEAPVIDKREDAARITFDALKIAVSQELKEDSGEAAALTNNVMNMVEKLGGDDRDDDA